MKEINLGEMLGALMDSAQQEERGSKRKLSNDVIVARLQEAAPSFISPPVFKVGDFITPRKDSPYKHPGQPSLVVETRYDDPILDPTEDASNHNFHTYCHAKVIMISGPDNDSIVAHWVDASYYEKWDG